MLMMLRGPSADFMLGHIFGWTEDSVYEGITERMKKEAVSKEFHVDKQIRASWAENMFNEQNCSLIGQ